MKEHPDRDRPLAHPGKNKATMDAPQEEFVGEKSRPSASAKVGKTDDQALSSERAEEDEANLGRRENSPLEKIRSEK